MELIEQIENYRPYNEQETRDKSVMLDCLNAFADVFTRDNALCHMTASAWVVNESFDRVLIAYHNLYDSWSWLGGHADGEEDLLAVALREVREESGVQTVRPASEDIFSLEVLTVDGHQKRGKYVSSHLHLNVTYLLIADDTDALTVKPDENSGVKYPLADYELLPNMAIVDVPAVKNGSASTFTINSTRKCSSFIGKTDGRGERRNEASRCYDRRCSPLGYAFDKAYP